MQIETAESSACSIKTLLRVPSHSFSYRLVDDCPLAKLRDEPDGLTNPHVQNLMVSMTRPLYMECMLYDTLGRIDECSFTL